MGGDSVREVHRRDAVGAEKNQKYSPQRRKGRKEYIITKKTPREFVCASMDSEHNITLRADKICNRLASFYPFPVFASLAPLR
jgi:hypothetical protein